MLITKASGKYWNFYIEKNMQVFACQSCSRHAYNGSFSLTFTSQEHRETKVHQKDATLLLRILFELFITGQSDKSKLFGKYKKTL